MVVSLSAAIADLTSLAHEVELTDAACIIADARLRLRMLKELKEAKERPVMTTEGGVIRPDPLTSAQVEDRLKIGHTYLNDLKKLGEIRWTRIARKDLFEVAEVDRFKNLMEKPREAKRVARLIAKRREEERERKARNTKRGQSLGRAEVR